MTAKPICREEPENEDKGKLFAAIDTETYGLDGRNLLSQLFCEGWDDAEVFTSIEVMLDRLFSIDKATLRKTIWYAHNAEYDWRYLDDYIKALGFTIAYKERCAGKFYELCIMTKGHKPKVVTRFRDSMAVFPFGLAKFTAEFAPEYKKDDIGLGNGGVMFDPSNPVHIEYAKNDVKGLVHALLGFDDLIYKNFSVHVKATASGTAYEAWKRTIAPGVVYWRQAIKVESFLRKCYHGGLVSVNAEYMKEYEVVDVVDINSSYPANMRKGVPAGRARYATIIHEGYPGYYHCKATIPDDAILPIVPHRSESGQLSWPAGGGVIDTYVSSIEIEHCQKLGVIFDEVEGYYFPEGLCYPFGEFVDICEGLRATHAKKPLEIVVKLMQNSLYGRFGMKPEGRLLIYDPEGQPDGYESVYDPHTNTTIPNLYYKEEIRKACYMLPHWAAWITANARILLDEGTEMAGRENVRYRDTDSGHMTGDGLARIAPLIGNKYGQFKVEDKKFNYRVHCPKGYTYKGTQKGVAGLVTKATAKGIPQKQIEYPTQGKVETDEQFAVRLAVRNELVRALHEGERPCVPFHSSTSMQTKLMTGKMYVMRKRRMTDPKKVYGHIIENGKFRPRRG